MSGLFVEWITFVKSFIELTISINPAVVLEKKAWKIENRGKGVMFKVEQLGYSVFEKKNSECGIGFHK